jgi:hypothetical protein
LQKLDGRQGRNRAPEEKLREDLVFRQEGIGAERDIGGGGRAIDGDDDPVAARPAFGAQAQERVEIALERRRAFGQVERVPRIEMRPRISSN